MSRRSPPLLVEDIWEAVEKIERYISGMDHDAFVGDEKTIDSVVRNLEIVGEAANRLPKISVNGTQRSSGLKSLVSDIGSFTIISISTWRLYADYPNRFAAFQIPDFTNTQTLTLRS